MRGAAGEDVGARPHRHHDLLERGVAGALAQAVDRALHLAGAVHHRGERIGDGHPEVVVAVRGPDRLVRVRDAPEQFAEERAPAIRHAVADRVGHVDRARARRDRRLEDAAEEVHVRAHRVLGRELDVVGVLARELDGAHGGLEHLLLAHAQLELHVDRARRDEGVDALPGRGRHGLAGAPDVVVVGARERAHGRVPHGLGDGADGLEVAGARRGEARLDHVDAQPLELLADPDLLVAGHGSARALLAVAHGGVENDQLVLHGSLREMGWNICRPVCRAAPQLPNWGVGYLAREAQQQAREARQREAKQMVGDAFDGFMRRL